MPRRWLDIGVMIPGTYQAAMAFLSLTPCQFWPCSGSFCLIYFTCHKIYSSTISLLLAAGRSEAPYLQPFSTGNSSTISYCTKLLYHTHALDSWKSPAALPAGLLVLCRAGQLWQWWGLHYERRGAHQTWLPGKSPSQWGIEWKQTTIIDVPLACLITRGYFGLKMFESRWQSPKTVLQVLVFQQIAGILATVGWIHSENMIAGADGVVHAYPLNHGACLGCYLGSGRAHSWSRSGAEVCSLLRWKKMVWFTI